jgi:3-hydroxyisobutyrate dehydrogenase-like beta-hydroxyacid dehydrogenase
MAHARSKVGVIGLGKMGSALAEALLAAGYKITVWNRTPEKAEEAVRAGAELASSVVEAVRSSDVLVACLTDHAAIKTVLMTDELGAALRSKILVNVTSMSAEKVCEMDRWAGMNGISLLKGSILTYPDDVRAGKSTMVYGGDKGVFEVVEPLLHAMGGRPVRAGDNPDDASKIGLAYACFLFPALLGFLHGAALCHRAGISIEAYARDLVLPVLKGPTLAGMLEWLKRACLARRYDEDLQATLNIWNVSASSFRDIASYRLDPGFLSAVKAVLDRAAAQGFGELDLAAVFEMLITENESSIERAPDHV